MKKVVVYIRDQHAQLYKGFLFILSIIFIVYLFPKEEKIRYEYNNLKGKPWPHENLIAPFDFAILKSKPELNKEKDEVLKSSKVYFKVDNSIKEKRVKYFTIEFEEKWVQSRFFFSSDKVSPIEKNDKGYNKSPKSSHFFKGILLLDSLYKKGIIQLNEVIENKPADFSIFVVDNNVEEERELGNLLTIQTAFSYIEKSLQNYKNIDKRFLLPILENSIDHNIVYDPLMTQKVRQQSMEHISLRHDIILKDQNIVSKGEILDARKLQMLESLKTEYTNQSGGRASYFFIRCGQFIIVSLCLSILIFFLSLFRKEVFVDNTKITLILILIILVIILVSITLKIERASIYLLPFCILPVIARVFFDTRLALFVHLVTMLIIGFMVPNRFEFIFIQILGGIATIFSIVDMHRRSQIFISAAVIFLTYSISYFAIIIIQEGNIEGLHWMDMSWFAVSAVLTLSSYPLIFIFEKVFGLISDVSLMELSDTNSPLLRELATRAPGTFQHSLQVANLAEEAIFKIGGNALLVRTGSLYHDVGKINMPMYFIENQLTGINPHEELSYEESSLIIINHVIQGIEMAKKFAIPEQIIDFIRTHHGTSTTGFFYKSFLNNFPNEKIDEKKFHYSGPIPFSKETAVLMMADAVEAASRSLKVYTAENIDNLIELIIDGQIKENQFINSDITFKDITTIKKIFRKKLINIYHLRIEYPR